MKKMQSINEWKLSSKGSIKKRKLENNMLDRQTLISDVEKATKEVKTIEDKIEVAENSKELKELKSLLKTATAELDNAQERFEMYNKVVRKRNQQLLKK